MTERSADCKARRTQSLVDLLVSIVIAMLLWPFPVARAMLSPTIHVAGVLATCVIVQLVYFALSASVWSQTLGMRLVEVRLVSDDGEPVSRGRAVQWGLVSAVIAPWYVVAPSSACAASIAERTTRTTVY